jgi:hypothetical protein
MLPYAEKSCSLILRLKLGELTGSGRRAPIGVMIAGVVVGGVVVGVAIGLIATENELAVPFTRLSSADGMFEPSVNSPFWKDRMFRLSWK